MAGVAEAADDSGGFRQALRAQIAEPAAARQAAAVTPLAPLAGNSQTSAAVAAGAADKNSSAAKPQVDGKPAKPKQNVDGGPAGIGCPVSLLAMPATPVGLPTMAAPAGGPRPGDGSAIAYQPDDADATDPTAASPLPSSLDSDAPSMSGDSGAQAAQGADRNPGKTSDAGSAQDEAADGSDASARDLTASDMEAAEPATEHDPAVIIAAQLMPPTTAATEGSKEARGSLSADATGQSASGVAQSNASQATQNHAGFDSAAASTSTAAPASGLSGTVAPPETGPAPPAQMSPWLGGSLAGNAAAVAKVRPGQRSDDAIHGVQKAASSDGRTSSPTFASPPEVPKVTAKSESPAQPRSLGSEQNQNQNWNQNWSQGQSQTFSGVATSPGQGVAPAPATAAITSPASSPATPSAPGSNGPIPSPAAGGPRDADTPPVPITVQSARVLERMGQVEMRVGVNTASFGNVELHATVNQDQVGASIATSHLELHAAMMAEMPSLQRAMEQHHLRLDSLDLNARAGGQDSGGSTGNQERSPAGAQSGYRFSPLGEAAQSPDSLPSPGAISAYSGGLSVHA